METEHSPLSPGSQGSSPPQVGVSVTNGASNSKVRLQSQISRPLMASLKSDRFGTGLIQQFTQMFRSLLLASFPICAGASLQCSAAATSSANYDAAVDLSKDRYGDPQKIISAYMDALVNLPAVVNSRELKGVRQLYDEVEANVRALGALGQNVGTYGELLLPLLFHNIPKEIRLSICNKIPKFLKEFKAELENRQRCEYAAVLHSSGSSVKEDQRSSPTKKGSGKGSFTGSALVAGSEGGVRPTCVYCRQPQPSAKCTI